MGGKPVRRGGGSMRGCSLPGSRLVMEVGCGGEEERNNVGCVGSLCCCRGS